MKSNRESSEVPGKLVIHVNLISIVNFLPIEILIFIGSFLPDNKSRHAYMLTCKTTYNLFQPELNFIQFLQSVVDDDRKTVERILNKNPNFLIKKPSENLVIESKLTWQIFYAEKPGTIATKRRQINMLELLLPYYAKLEQTEAAKLAKEEVLSALSFYEMRKNAQGEDEIVIPEKYTNDAKLLIEVFSEETCPYGFGHFEYGQGKYGYGMLSEKTEEALSKLFDTLLPKEAVRLDDYLDIELYLLALYRAYFAHFNTFKNWEQRDAFFLRVRGLVQSALMPETGKIFCTNLARTVADIKKGKKVKISDNAMEHKLEDGDPFYRSSRDSKDGQGFKFFTGLFGIRPDGLFEFRKFHAAYEKLLLNKNNKLAELMELHLKPKTSALLVT